MSQSPPRVLPLFPLPDVVFFPGTKLPLHVFEPRYRQLVEDVIRERWWIAVPLLRPGHLGEIEGAPPFHDLAGAGRLTRYTRLPDGRFQVLVEGRARVRLSEVASERLYRKARAVTLPEAAGELEGRTVEGALRQGVRLAAELGLLETTQAGLGVPRDGDGRLALVNRIASVVLAESTERQGILETDDPRQRLELVLRQLRISARLLEALARSPRPRKPEEN